MSLVTLLCVSIIAATASAWIHPGILHKSTDIARMTGYITAGLAGTASHQYSDYLLFAASSYSSDAYAMSTPVATMESRAAFEADATAAYQNALMWTFTGIQAHANKAIQIMDAWSSIVTSVDDTYLDYQLASSLGPFAMTNAAEIIRYTSAGWTTAGITAFTNMLDTVFYPRLDVHTGVQYEANVGTGNTKALLAFAVFTENTTMYDEAIGFYSNERCSGLSLDISSTGQSSESGRDQGHTQLGLGNLAESCQIAWIQGTADLFALLANRLMAGFEYTAAYNLGNTVAYDASFQRCDADLLGGPFAAISTSTRGTFRPIYELAYAHYVTIKGLTMPYSLQIALRVPNKRLEFKIDLFSISLFDEDLVRMEAPTPFVAHVVPISPFDMLAQHVLTTYCFVIPGQLDATKMHQSFDKLVKEHWPIVGARLRKDPTTGLPVYHVPESFSDDLPTCIFQHEHIEGPEKWTSRRKTDAPSIQDTYSAEMPLYLPGDRPATMEVYYSSNRPLFLIKMTTASKANVTYLSLTAPHIFNDGGGLTVLLEGWSAVLKDQANLVPPLFPTAPMDSWKLSKPVDEGTPGVWLADPADLARMFGESSENVVVKDIFVPGGFLSALREDAMEALKARGVADSFLSEGDCLWAWWTKEMLPARKDKLAKVNLGQAINFRKTIPGFSQGPRRHIHNAVGMQYLPSSFSAEDMDAMPLHELAYTIRQSILNLHEHPEDIQDVTIMMSQIFKGGKPYVNFNPKLALGIFTNWLSLGLDSPAVDFSPALEGSTASTEAGRIINVRSYSMDSSDSSMCAVALCKDGDGDIWMEGHMHRDLWDSPRLQALTV
ncbi:chondroitin AC/alginate lyase [Athelia psychrophila]|uniref:Chondroitin AC/alginate lyase n=1 Tax=Athelia psychrophila TaxID=1759441 RepID=A0A166RHI6_9AGAM|nr:chondroitin AC/alginate lyase [Fibularhizoctonia sp. CBS 109695]